MDTHNRPTPTTSPTDTALLAERCAYCDAPMYVLVRGHHHTELGEDVTRRVPEWVRRAQAGQLVRKDMTGTVAE